MPTRPPRACTQPGCGATTLTGGKCSDHRHAIEVARGSSTHRGYDRDWRKIRARYLARFILCVDAYDQERCDQLGASRCRSSGRVEAATVVDHIDGNAWNRDFTNLRSLCATCHNRRTMRDQVSRE